MKYYQICFSPTGGTQKVADLLATEWMDEIVKVDLTDCKTDFTGFKLTKEDVALIVVPSYSGRVPEIAVKRISRLQGNCAKTVIACVYGNRAYEDTLIELYDTVQRNGFKVIAAVAAVAEHSMPGAMRLDDQMSKIWCSLQPLPVRYRRSWGRT